VRDEAEHKADSEAVEVGERRCRDAEGVRVGFVGLGNMGGRITRRIVAGGYPVLGHDVDPARAAEAGATAASSPAAVTEASDVVLLSLPDSPVVEAVVLGDGGVLAGATEGQVVVDLSTSSPSSTVELHRRLVERGVEFVDAGISGGAAAAEQGTLTIMAGGSEQALDRVRPVLDTFSARVYHMGATGSGHTAKLLNNFLNGISLAATAEVMVAARKAGLELHTFLDVLNSSSGVNFATLNRFPRIVDGDYLEGGLTGNLMLKDLRLYAELVRELEVRTLTAAGCIEAFELAAELGYGEQISNRVVDAIGDLSGGVRLQDDQPTST
jgi:3-hydroxyisobutyrate dehydrogenase-like beta-hydroxyacid dehydrogenase